MDFITISRQFGSGGADIATRVAETLGYRLNDTRAIVEMAREMGIFDSVVKVDEKAPSLFHRFLTHTPEVNMDRLSSVIHELALRGNAVFLGRGSQVLLKSFDCAFHVRVIASHKKRVDNLIRKGLAPETAEKAIRGSDRERSGFIRFAFGVDWNDPSLYDITLNMDKLPIDLAAAAICDMVRSGAIRTCSVDAVDALAMLALTERVEAALIESGASYGPATAISVSMDNPGEVRLSGVVEDEKTRARIEGVTKGVTGVTKIDDRIRVRPLDRHA